MLHNPLGWFLKGGDSYEPEESMPMNADPAELRNTAVAEGQTDVSALLTRVQTALNRNEERRAHQEFDRLKEVVWDWFADQLRRTGVPPDEIEELLTETGRRLWEALKNAATRGEAIQSFYGYGKTIVRSVATDHLRQKRGKRRILSNLELILTNPDSLFPRWENGGVPWVRSREMKEQRLDPTPLTERQRQRIQLDWDEATAPLRRAQKANIAEELIQLLTACFREVNRPLPFAAVKELALDFMQHHLPQIQSLDVPTPETGATLSETLPQTAPGTEEQVVRADMFRSLREGMCQFLDELPPASRIVILLGMEEEALQCLLGGENVVPVLAATLVAACSWSSEEAGKRAEVIAAKVPLPDAETAMMLGIPVQPHLYVLRHRVREKFKKSSLEQMRQEWASVK